MPTYLDDKYLLGKTLGSGASCKVRLARDVDSNRYAIKVFKSDVVIDKLLASELATLKKLSHPGIINLVEQGKGNQVNTKKGSKEVQYIVLELADGGELFDFIALGGQFSEPVARLYTQQLMTALQYMHENGITHRDLKPENLLLNGSYQLKIADFGFAAPIEGRDGSGLLTTKVGTNDYMAPEIHLGMPYEGESIDLFSCGIIMFMMLTQRPPFRSSNKDDPHYKLLAAERADIFWKAHEQAEGSDIYSDEFKDLFEKMVALNPKERLTLDEILAHPWMQGPKANLEGIKEEFDERKKIVHAAAADQEIEQKRSERAQRNKGKREGKINRGDCEVTPEQIESHQQQLEEWRSLEVRDYEEYSHPGNLTQFFTTSDPLEAFTALVDTLEAMQTELKVDANWLKIRYTHKVVTEYEEEEGEEESKEDAEEKEVNPIDVTVCVLKVNEHKYCVDFQLKSGNREAFLEHYRDELIASEEIKTYLDAERDE